MESLLWVLVVSITVLLIWCWGEVFDRKRWQARFFRIRDDLRELAVHDRDLRESSEFLQLDRIFSNTIFQVNRVSLWYLVKMITTPRIEERAHQDLLEDLQQHPSALELYSCYERTLDSFFRTCYPITFTLLVVFKRCEDVKSVFRMLVWYR